MAISQWDIYPTLNGTDATSPYGLFQFVNNGVHGTLFPIILLVIWIVAFIGVLAGGKQASRGFIFASFIGSILSILFTLMGLLNSQYMYLSFLMVAIGIVWSKLDNAVGL